MQSKLGKKHRKALCILLFVNLFKFSLSGEKKKIKKKTVKSKYHPFERKLCNAADLSLY